MRSPIEHAYTLEGEPYRLREATMMEGQQRIGQYYALALTLAPGTVNPDTGLPLAYNETLWAGYAHTLETLYGGALYAKALTQECLVEAPDFWWLPQPVTPSQNGSVKRTVTFKDIPAALWTAHLQEVQVFLEKIFRVQTPEPVSTPPGGPGESDLVAHPDPASPLLRGRAE
jgi:hypothetical protein